MIVSIAFKIFATDCGDSGRKLAAWLIFILVHAKRIIPIKKLKNLFLTFISIPPILKICTARFYYIV